MLVRPLGCRGTRDMKSSPRTETRSLARAEPSAKPSVFRIEDMLAD